MSSIVPVLVIGVLSSIILVIHFRHSPAPLAGVPYNKSSRWHPFGDIPRLLRASTPVDFFSQHVRKHGTISEVLLGPLGRFILVADAKEIEDHLQKHSEYFDKSTAVRAAFSGTLPEGSVGLPSNAKWKLHRRMMTPSMSPAFLATKMTHIAAGAQRLIDIWTLKSQNGLFECNDDIERFAMDIIMDVLFGENLGCLLSTYNYLISPDQPGFTATGGAWTLDAPSPPAYKSIRALLKGIGNALQSASSRLVYWRLRLSPTWRSARREGYRFIDKKLEEHNVGQGTPNIDPESFLSRLSARYPGGRPAGVELSGLRDEILTYIIGGADTSATVIGWMIKFLTLNPRVQMRLRAEISASFTSLDTVSISFEELQGVRFPYLEAVVHESLRLANVAGVSVRDALRDVTIAGHRIPQGSQVVFLTGHSGIYDAPSLVENSDIKSNEFYPERWLEQSPGGARLFSSSKVTTWPFGYGPRMCPGQRLALLELKAFLLYFSLSFFLEQPPEATDSRAKMLVVLRKPVEMCIKIRKWGDI